MIKIAAFSNSPNNFLNTDLGPEESASPSLRTEPSPSIKTDTNIELVLARHLVTRAIYIGPPALLLFGIWKGWEGVWGALAGLALVIGNFLVAGYILSFAARISVSLYHAAALFGFFLRLALLTLSMLLVLQLIDLDRMAFAITTVVSYLTLLSWESIAVIRGREKETEWAG